MVGEPLFFFHPHETTISVPHECMTPIFCRGIFPAQNVCFKAHLPSQLAWGCRWRCRPSPQSYASIAFDKQAQLLLVCVGKAENGSNLKDTWSFTRPVASCALQHGERHSRIRLCRFHRPG